MAGESEATQGSVRPFETSAGRFVSIVLGLAALVWVGTRIDIADTMAHLRASNYAWFALGFALFYVSLPLRAWRWRLMLQNLGMSVPVRALATTIFLAWAVNCFVPGRAGDAYSAFVLRDEHGASVAATAGSILAARVLDFGTLIALLTIAFYAGFHARTGNSPLSLLGLAWGIASLVLVGLVVLGCCGEWMERRLSPRWASAWSTFRAATFRSVRRMPALVSVTVSLWLLEVLRLWCVLGAVDASRPILPVALLSLVAAVVTTLPITPGGLGTVEALYHEFLPELGIRSSAAVSAAILDRAISYWFILVVGGPLLLFRRRSHRRHGP